MACDFFGKPDETTVVGLPGGEVHVPGHGRLSGNGRYLFTYHNVPPTITDLQTGRARTVLADMYDNFGAGRIIADDGTLVTGAGSLILVTSIYSRKLSVAPGFEPYEGVIDALGRVVVYTAATSTGGPRALRIYRIGGDQDNPLVDGPGSKAAPFVSADGTRVMFLDNVSGARQVWTVRADGTGLRQVTHELGGVLSAVMSDDGKVAWYVSGSGRICQVSLDSGIAVARAGTITEVFTIPDLVAGSTAIISGMGFSDTADYANSVPLPRKLGGVSVSIGGVDVPLISVSPTSIALQVPWEDSTGSGPTLSFDVHVDSPASEVSFPMYEWGPVEVSAVSPIFILNLASPSPRGGYDVVAAHENWDGLVTAQNPGKPNEIIHIYGTGFGKVNAAPATGYPATADPPASTMFPVFCWAGPGLTQALPIIFSGLAPGLVGYYQIDMQLPASGVYDKVEFYCIGAGVIGGGKFSGSFWMLPLQ